jgi:hypothetical protein
MKTSGRSGCRPGYLRSFFGWKIHLVAGDLSCSFQLPGDFFEAEQLAPGSNKLAGKGGRRSNDGPD